MVNYSTGKGCYFSVHAVVPTYNRSNDAISFVPAVTLIHYILSVFLLWWIHCSGLQVQFIVLFSFSTMSVPLRVCCLLYLQDFLPVNAVKHNSCVCKDLNHSSLTELFPRANLGHNCIQCDACIYFTNFIPTHCFIL